MEIVEYQGERVLMTYQLADAYGTDTKNLNDNYQNNSARFKEGKHYFALTGNELKEFKASTKISGNLKFAPILHLWTVKGSWMHAKSLNTDKAWEAYELLVDDYYDKKEVEAKLVPSYMLEDPESRALRWIQEHKERKMLEESKLMLEREVEKLKPVVDYVNVILQSKGLLNITQIAKDYGMTGTELNKILEDLGIQYKQNKQWLLYKKYADKGYTQSSTIPIVRTGGIPDTRLNTQWTQRGRLFIHEELKKLGIKANIEKEYDKVN